MSSDLHRPVTDLPKMLADLEELVLCESFSADLDAVARSADVVAAQGARLLGARPDRIVIDGVTHLRWTFGTPRVLLLGHHDTVWPVGTLARHPWSVLDGVARGPGVFDMKAGLVQLFHALAALPSLDGVSVLVTGDEEVGSVTSRALIEESARGCAAVFVPEPSAGGALKTARKGISLYEVVLHGRAAHAGLEPERGINATVEAAHQILAIASLAALADTDTDTDTDTAPAAGEGSGKGTGEGSGKGDGGAGGTTVTPTVVAAGTTGNTVPATARISVDARVATMAAQARVDELMRGLSPRLPGARVEVLGGPNRPPLEEAASRELFALAQKIAAELGMAPLRGVAVGGGSDGNFTAGAGYPTLDGLGAVGGGAHADDEHVVVADMPSRATLLAGLVATVTR
ncbi:glutamate carboxypeptidase [Microtetraspora sp. NBRC 13810]|uniref:M20/M25/M40 family metallo-hydrolase n=1 Tax=Microtetraspora sp. NBRC 13810 TaxID=3030990 RepID=UPI0024A05C0C|nr:M20/M25/M40 family metallo-hydrolase [Microtetraspora sp. NBRC 13810]GLW11001.1 glutamate carboxypeptidase [Microtetraspora sp. NBRC 13810]